MNCNKKDLEPRLSSIMEYGYKKIVFDTLHFGKIIKDVQELTVFTMSIGFSPKVQTNLREESITTSEQ